MIGLPIGRAHPWQKCTDPLHLFAFLPMIYSQKQVDDKTKLAWAKPTHLRTIQHSSDVSGNKIGMNSAGETEKGFGKNKTRLPLHNAEDSRGREKITE